MKTKKTTYNVNKVRITDKIIVIKRRLFEGYGIPLDRQILSLSGKLMEDNDDISGHTLTGGFYLEISPVPDSKDKLMC